MRWNPFSRPPAPPPPAPIDDDLLRRIVALVNEKSQPNINALSEITRNIDILSLNVKTLGYGLAREIGKAVPPPAPTRPVRKGLRCALSNQRDIESRWLAYWCAELKIPVIYHRKIWELAYVLQALHDSGMLRDGVRGLGFGCGQEPIASYLASREVTTLITDLAADDARSLDWSASTQHAASLEQAFHPELVSRERFLDKVDFRALDMTAIPEDVRGFDFCWSICALEHLGSIEAGLVFVERALDTLRPGGVAIHTTEFNVENDGPTIDNWSTVLFQRRHIDDLAARLTARGHSVAPLRLDPGRMPLDHFIDVPPFEGDLHHALSARLGPPAHLKLAIAGFVSTCIGLTVTKAPAAP